MNTKRKRISFLVTVSVPEWMSPSEARREVRTLISEQCNFAAEPHEVKATRVTKVPDSWVESHRK
jgi:hypothetical protein